MKRADKAARIGALFDELYPVVDAPLAFEDPFELLLAVVLSVQCTDERVLQVAPRLFALASTPQSILELGDARLLELIRSCGLGPAKTRSIRGISAALLEQHGGKVPAQRAALEALPGVGHKVASVVLGQAFGEYAFPIDTHIERLARRWGLSRAKSVSGIERDLCHLFEPATWHRRHLQFIFFGRQYCPARYHDFEACPICAWASSRAQRARERARWRREPKAEKKTQEGR
ncbi:MAG: endonuclease III [Myxococcota bacterium]|jgi:endonuclease-3|nr:endonuclease III [Myxococcota bacterium]